MSRRIEDHEYVCEVWFERDRAHIVLSTPKGRKVFELWDADVWQALEDGFMPRPGGPMMSSAAMNDAARWQPCAVEYAREAGLIN